MIFGLFVASLKMIFRDRLTLFWGLAFPVMFVVIFGLLTIGEGSGSASIAIIDHAGTQQSSQFISNLRQIQFFKFNESITNEEEAQQAIREGRLDTAIIIPESFTLLGFGEAAPETIELTVYYNRGNIVEYQLIKSVLSQIFSEINLSLAGVPRLFALHEEALDARESKYIDFLLPGILGMGLMMNGIVGISVDLTRFREQRILKRMRITPLPPRVFVVSQVLAYLVLVAIQATLVILVGVYLFKATIVGSILSLYLLALIGTLIFLNIGFVVAGFSKTPTGASGLSQVVAMPMMFLSGTFFPTDGLPSLLSSVVHYLPLTPLLEALRAVSLNNMPLTALGSEFLLIAAWLVISFALAAAFFKFRAE